jgi:hypothetical protein
MREMLLSITILLLSAEGAFARGGFADEPPRASHHVEGLPDELQRLVLTRAAACGNEPSAQHLFTVSIEGQGRDFISFHYDKFTCRNRATVCRSGGCLHEVFVRGRNGWLPVFQAYADETTLGNDGGRVCLEVRKGWTTQTYSWVRNRFSPVIGCRRP